VETVIVQDVLGSRKETKWQEDAKEVYSNAVSN